MPITGIEYFGLRSVSYLLQRPLSTWTRGQQLNNTQDKSVSASSTKSKAPKNKASKASKERQSRKDSYRKKFNRPHMIIPQEDFEWLRDQTNSVKTLFMECWMSDPYGSCFMQLNHSLSYKSFMRGKKAIEEKGLFLFRPKKSMIPNHHKETVCWEVFNLHGARRTDFWLNLNSEESPPEDKKKPDLNSQESSFKLNLDGQESPRKDNDVLEKRQKNSRDGQECPSEKSEPIANRRSQNPSGGSQECLSNSPKELLETLTTDLWSDDRDRDTAFDGRVTSASPNGENSEAEGINPTEVQPDLVNKSDLDSKQIAQSAEQEAPRVLNNESTKEIQEVSQVLNIESTKNVLNQSYSVDKYSTDSVELSKAQNLAFEAERTTETHQTSFSDGAARIKAKLARDSKNDKIKRFGYEPNPMSLADRQALEEYKRELEF